MAIVECVPNISEGRRGEVIEACAAAVREGGARLLDVSADPDHHRSVLTFAGEPAAVRASALALADRAVELIDLRQHAGVHPRLGALDVLPFVPLDGLCASGADMAACIALARDVAAALARRHGLPVFLYEDAALRPDRRSLADIRRGGFEALPRRLAEAAWSPDFGPSAVHPSAGATVVGARGLLVAYNVNLATDRADVARRIAALVREGNGGLPRVRAMGVWLAQPRVAQVSMNLLDYRVTPVAAAYEAVARAAAREGVPIADSEIVGLAPAAALPADPAASVRLRAADADRVLERRLGDLCPDPPRLA